MGFFDIFGGDQPPPKQTEAVSEVSPRAESVGFNGLNDPALYEYMRTGGRNGLRSLEVSTVYRCIALISNAIGMLPLRVMTKIDGNIAEEALDHPLFNVLMSEPNSYQTAFEFRQLMQSRVLTHGNAYAQVVRSGERVTALLPLDPDTVQPEQLADGQINYRVTTSNGVRNIAQANVLHIRGMSSDGIVGMAAVQLATEAIGLSRDAAESLSRIYRSGISAGGVVTHPQRLSPEARARLKSTIEDYSGSSNAGKFMVLDEGIEAKYFEKTARDSQTLETAKHQVEEIARFFGVPRPLLAMDDTSWGSGVEQLATLFVRFALAPYFTLWEQAVNRTLLSRGDKRFFTADFDERELLRGSMKDQAEYYAKASGAGGHMPWMTPNEIREDVGLAALPGGDALQSPVQAANSQGNTHNDTTQPPANQGA